MMTDLKQYLRDMTNVALKHNIIIAEPLEAVPCTYDAEHGNKLYWDCESKQYVFVTPQGLVRAYD